MKKELSKILYALNCVYDAEIAQELFEKILILSKSNYVSSKVVPLSTQVHLEQLQILED